jgi:hypothetical protein
MSYERKKKVEVDELVIFLLTLNVFHLYTLNVCRLFRRIEYGKGKIFF